MKILWGVNVLDSVKSEVYASHVALAAYFKTQHPKWALTFFTPQRMSIDRMRNEAAKMALEADYDYLMFVDDDVLVEPQVFDSLLSCDADVAMAETYIRGYPFNAMWFKNVGGKLEHDNDSKADESGLIECDAVGFSCVLIKVSLLKKVTMPFFVTGPNFTEDVYFCTKAKAELGDNNVKIVVDTRYPTGHLLTPTFVHKQNVKILRAFHKVQIGAVQEHPKDRGEEYLKEVEALFQEAL
jgi:hypothetical protein